MFILRESTGIRSTTEVVRFALRKAVDAPSLLDYETREVTPNEQNEREKALEAALKAHQKALNLWTPTGFEGVRAKAAAEESLRGLGLPNH